MPCEDEQMSLCGVAESYQGDTANKNCGSSKITLTKLFL